MPAMTAKPIATFEVRCGNPYFKGTVEGVQFTPATGGARGMATRDQAQAIVKQKSFSCDALKDKAETGEPKAADDPLTSVKGIGKASEQRLHEAGISTLEELAAATPRELSKAVGTAQPTVTGWIETAKALLSD